MTLLPRVGLMAAAMVLAFLICELGARLIFPRPPEGTRQPEIGYLLDPEIRYIMAPSQKGWIDEGLVTINALGFRGAEVDLRKPSDRFRVAVIGDSLTLGWGVSDQETYAARLERLLRSRLPDGSIDVLNLGIGGYNTRQEVAFLERHLAALEPDLVLVGFYLNDVPEMLEDTGPSAGRGAQRADVPQGGRPLRLNPTPSGWWHRQVRRSRLLYIAARAFNRTRGVGEQGRTQFEMEMALLSGVESEQMQRAWDKVAGQFSRLRKLADAHGFAVGIIALPCREQVTGEAQSTAYRDRLRTLADAHAFHTIDPVPVMRERADDGRRLYIPYDRNHPSAEGHALIAQAIFRHLIENRVIGSPAGVPQVASGAARRRMR